MAPCIEQGACSSRAPGQVRRRMVGRSGLTMLVGVDEAQKVALNWKNGVECRRGRVTTRPVLAASKSWQPAGSAMSSAWWRISMLGVVSWRCAGRRALAGLERDEVHAVELVAEVAPGVAGLRSRRRDEQEREPAELNVGCGCGPRGGGRPAGV